MPEQMNLTKLEKNLNFFQKMFDMVRLVDPVRKRVLESRGCGTASATDEICHAYWKNGRICENCISVRAFKDNKSYMKLEQKQNVIMMVTALPVESERPVILELMKNATDSMMIGTGEYNSGQMMRNVVHDINSLVVKDHLTSIYNRRFVDDRLPVDIVDATVNGKPLSVIFIDIDNMKEINDSYGHIAGDLALKLVAGAMRSCIRGGSDWAARYGGDEFLICLNGIGREEAERIGGRIGANIRATRIPVKGGNVAVTASMGIQTMEDTAFTAEELIRRADEKMYRAKKASKSASENSRRSEP